MGKLTKAERAELEARLRADDDDDESDEVQVGFADGSHFRGSWKRAKGVAAARGVKLERDPEDDGQDDEDSKGSEQGGEVKRFAGRRLS